MQLLFNIYLLLLGVTLVTGLVSFKKLAGPFRLLVATIAYILTSEILTRLLLLCGFENTFPLYHLNAVVLIAMNTLIYLRLLDPNSVARRTVIIVSAVCFIAAVGNSLFHQSIQTFPSFSIAAHTFQSILLALIMFNEMIKSPVLTPLAKQSLFWFNFGTFLFYSSNFVSFVLYNEYYQVRGITMTWVFYLNWIGNMVLYGCYLAAFLLNRKGL